MLSKCRSVIDGKRGGGHPTNDQSIALGEYRFYKKGGNKVAHVLAQYARTIIDDMYWMEDLPPLAMEALYQDANFID